MGARARAKRSHLARSLMFAGCVLTAPSVPKGEQLSMLETNIRIVQPGTGLRLVVRRASLEGPDLSNDLLERACGTLRYRYGLAAIPTGRSGVRELLVAGNRPVPEIVVDGQGGRLVFGIQIKLKNKFIWLAQKTGWPYLSCSNVLFWRISRSSLLCGPWTVHESGTGENLLRR